MNMFAQILLFAGVVACVSSIPCPGGTHECPEGATCCELPDKDYGCCPLPNAVCCDDHIHCCPGGFVCNAGMCSQSSYNTTHSEKQESVVCPGGVYTCPSDSSCCKNDDGEVIGCCIEPDAVCCPGGQYCCPNNTSCDLHSGQCKDKRLDNKVPDRKVTKAQKPKEIEFLNHKISTSNKQVPKLTLDSALTKYFAIICPDGQSRCPDGYTCCELQQGSYGCCPFPNANCCPDHLHCCPDEMRCSVASTSCERAGVNISSFKTLDAIKFN